MKRTPTLNRLVGKTITKVEVGEYDYCSDEERVGEIYRITCSDESVLHFCTEAGDCSFNAYVSFCDMDNITNGDGGKMVTPFSEVTEYETR